MTLAVAVSLVIALGGTVDGLWRSHRREHDAAPLAGGGRSAQ
jgi:hypothetical protein